MKIRSIEPKNNNKIAEYISGTILNKIIIVAFLILIAFSWDIASGQNQATNWVLNQPINGGVHEYEANEYIKLKPGFKYTPNTGGRFSGKILPFMVNPPMAGATGGPAGYENLVGNGGIVGATKGNFMVSDGGQAVYSIPLEFPAGVGGMSPDLSLIYTSNGPDGILGPGWGLGGLSVISLVPPSRYHNGIKKANGGLDYLDNNYTLDGSKLIKITPDTTTSTNNWEYRTENDNFSTITRLAFTLKDSKEQENSKNSSFYFEVKTKSGLTYYYGGAFDSRQGGKNSEGTPHIVNYYVSSIVDQFGNKIQFDYSNDLSTGEIYLEKIYYTIVESQNSPDQSNYTIVLDYIQRSSPITTNYLYLSNVNNNSYEFKVSRLIDRISCVYKNDTVKSYRIDYQKRGVFDGINDSRTSHIAGIQEFGRNGEKLNKTAFTWENQSDFKSTEVKNLNLPRLQYWAPSSNYSYPFDKYKWRHLNHTFLDINNDGEMEIIRTYEFIKYNTYLPGTTHNFAVEILKKDISSNTFIITEHFLIRNYDEYNRFENNEYFTIENEGLKPSYPMFSYSDFNGDSYVDVSLILFELKYESGHGYVPMRSKSILLINNNGVFNSPPVPLKPPVIINRLGFFRTLPGDFNGDGITDLLWNSVNTNTNFIVLGAVNNPLAGSTDYSGSDSISYEGNLSFEHPIEVIDFDGDGRSDIIEHKSAKSVIYKSVYRGTSGAISFEPFDIVKSRSCFLYLDTDKKMDYCGQYEISVDYKNVREDAIPLIIRFKTKKGNGEYFINDFLQHEFTDTIYSFGPDGTIMTGISPWILYEKLLDINKDGQSEIIIRYRVDVEYYDDILNETYYRQYYNNIVFFPNKEGVSFSVKKWPSLPELFNYNEVYFDGNQQMGFYRDVNKAYDKPYSISILSLPEHGTAISSIVDGMGNKIDIEYGYSSSKDVYTASLDAPNTYPVIPLTSTLKLVKGVKRSNGIGGFRVEKYKYQDAIYHAEGLGFMGFKKMIREDVSLGFSEITVRDEWHPQLFYFTKEKKTTKITNDATLQEKVSNFEHKSLNGGKNYFVYETSSSSKSYDPRANLLKVEESNNDYDNYGNLTKSINKTGDAPGNLPFVRIVNNYYPEDEEGRRFSRIDSARVEYQMQGEPSVIKRSSFKYYASGIAKGMLQQEIIEPGDSLSSVKIYEYDQWGNITKSITQGTGIQNTQEIRTEYQNQDALLNGRFLTKKIIPGDNRVEYIEERRYDPCLGLVLESKDANNHSTFMEYDGFGKMFKETAPDGKVSASVLRWVQEGDANAPQYAMFYNWAAASGTAPVKIYYSSTGAELRTVTIGMDGASIYVDTHYDNLGRILKKSEPYFANSSPVYTHYLSYDKLHRPLGIQHPDSSISHFVYEGNTTRVINAKGHISSKTYNAAGWLIESTDQKGGKVVISYRSDGLVKDRMVAGYEGTRRDYRYDALGNLIYYSDRSQGTLHYKYNSLGQLAYDINAKGQKTSYHYDRLGRLIKKNLPGAEGEIQWEYYETTGKKGLLKSAKSTYNSNLSHEIVYSDYDPYGRPKEIRESVFGEEYISRYSYDLFGRLSSYTFPETGLTIQNHYNSLGYQVGITNASDGSSIWQALGMNARNQFNSIKIGNSIVQSYEYFQSTGLIKRINAGSYQNESYTWDEIGNLNSRMSRNGRKEVFFYDELGRMIKTERYNPSSVLEHIDSLNYNSIGNIMFKSGLGSYEYDDFNPYKLNFVNGLPVGIDPKKYTLTYTSFNKISIVNQFEPEAPGAELAEMNLFYGVDNQRIKQVIGRPNGESETKVYIGRGFEKHIKNNQTKYVHYISSPSGLAAIIEQDAAGNREINYVLCDHLGSIQVLVNQSNQIVQEYSYDAWGMRRDPATWVVYLNASDYLTNRGFTGHEHIDLFMLVNMNGRIYDPLVGVFLSPDPVLQFANFTQGLHPYAYCLNNPLRFIDPEGYSLQGQLIGITLSSIASFIFTPVVGSIVYAIVNTIDQAIDNKTTPKLEDFVMNIMMSLAMMSVNNAIGSLFDIAKCGKVEKALLQALVHGTKDGAIRKAQGGKFEHGFMSGFVSSLGGSMIQGSQKLGYVEKVLIAAAIGGTAEKLGGGKFANGAVTGAYVMMFNHMGAHGENKERKYIEEYRNIRHDTGGFLEGATLTDFEDFMFYMAQNNTVEVSAFELKDGRYFIEPWNTNEWGASNSFPTKYPDKFSWNNGDIVAQYHTHPDSDWMGIQDARYSSKYGFKVYAYCANGAVYDLFLRFNQMVHISPLGYGQYNQQRSRNFKP